MRERFNNFGPETQPFPAMAKRRGRSAAWRMPMRGVTTTRPARVPSSRSCKGDSGSSKSSPLSASPRNSQRLAQPARAARQFFQLTAFCFRAPSISRLPRKAREVIQAAIPRHLFETRYRFQGAYQHASTMALALARNIHAEVHPINEIDIRMPSGSEQYLISRRGAAMRVRRRIGSLLVRSQIGLGFNNAPGQPSGTAPAREHFAQKPPRHAFRWRLKERTLQQLARWFSLLAKPQAANPANSASNPSSTPAPLPRGPPA